MGLSSGTAQIKSEALVSALWNLREVFLNFDSALGLFLRHLRIEKLRSQETIRAYVSDLASFSAYLTESGKSKELRQIQRIDQFHIRGFLASGFARLKKTSIGRRLAAIRNFLSFLGTRKNPYDKSGCQYQSPQD